MTSWSYRKKLTLSPLVSSWVLLTTLAVFYSQTSRFAMGLAIFIESLGSILVILSVLDIHRLFLALQAGQQQRMAVQEAERRHLAQDLHDDALQQLIDLKRHFSHEKVDRIITTIRRTCQHLKPLMLEELGLAQSLRFLANEFIQDSPTCTLTLTMDEKALHTLPKPHQLVIFRVVQESLTNCRRHAKASSVQVILSYNPPEDHQARLTIIDNGQGLPKTITEFVSKDAAIKTSSAHPTGDHLGLIGILDRVTDLGGKATWHSRHSKPAFSGTKLVVVLPL
ncbi:MAG: ATP-binding protein [Vampirovibrionales bacterium]|nr:ATP-binding protein [Vampirovibrionales bacterium]